MHRRYLLIVVVLLVGLIAWRAWALLTPKPPEPLNLEPVGDSLERRQVTGQLSEAHALRRYSDASERQRRELLGET